MAEAGSVCLEEQGHALVVSLLVDGQIAESFSICRFGVSQRMRDAHNDDEVTTEHGAYGLAIVLVRSLTDLTVLRRSKKGTGFDYWLGFEDGFLFRDAARLEVSGIRRGSEGALRSRMSAKKRQMRVSKEILPAWVAVVEFSAPRLRIETI